MTTGTRLERRIVVGHRMIGVVEDDGTERRLIANFYQPQTTVAEARENARLFLAAPDLLKALRDLVLFEGPDSRTDQATDPRLRLEREWAVARACHALAKARGES